eukprot:gene11727-14353_t
MDKNKAEEKRLKSIIFQEYLNESIIIENNDLELIGVHNELSEKEINNRLVDSKWKLDSKLNRLLLPLPHIIIHIPKTAGTSLYQIVQSNVNETEIYHKFEHPDVDELKVSSSFNVVDDYHYNTTLLLGIRWTESVFLYNNNERSNRKSCITLLFP